MGEIIWPHIVGAFITGALFGLLLDDLMGIIIRWHAKRSRHDGPE